MKNVQISFDEKLLLTIDHFAAASQLSRSAIVRKALKSWMKEQEIKAFEEQWMATLQQNADNVDNAEEWVQIETWSDQ